MATESTKLFSELCAEAEADSGVEDKTEYVFSNGAKFESQK